MQIVIVFATLATVALIWFQKPDPFADPALLDMSEFANEMQDSDIDLRIPEEFLDRSPPSEEEINMIPRNRGSA